MANLIDNILRVPREDRVAVRTFISKLNRGFPDPYIEFHGYVYTCDSIQTAHPDKLSKKRLNRDICLCHILSYNYQKEGGKLQTSPLMQFFISGPTCIENVHISITTNGCSSCLSYFNHIMKLVITKLGHLVPT